MRARPTIDVVIPTYRPDTSLRELLSRLLQQTDRIEHILVINTEEKYWDPELVEGLERVDVFHITKEQFDHGGTRNEASQLSDADILVYMTQDAMPESRALIHEMVMMFHRERVKVVYARQIPRSDCRILEGYTRTYNYPDESMEKGMEDLSTLGIKTFFCSNVCAAYDHETLKRLGGFPDRIIFGEDMIYAAKVVAKGFTIGYAARACVVHSHNYSAIQQLHRNFDVGVFHRQYNQVFKKVKSEKEGFRLVRETQQYLHSVGHDWLIPKLYWTSFCKALGYKLGKQYRMLPRPLVKALSMNRQYWNNVENIEQDFWNFDED